MGGITAKLVLACPRDRVAIDVPLKGSLNPIPFIGRNVAWLSGFSVPRPRNYPVDVGLGNDLEGIRVTGGWTRWRAWPGLSYFGIM